MLGLISVCLASGLVALWLFVPPDWVLAPFVKEQVVSVLMFAISSIVIVWAAESFRGLLFRLREEEGTRCLLNHELDHRIKNSLQIVSSLLHMHANTAGAAAGQFHNAAARVAAIAAVHQQLHQSDDVGTVALHRYLVDLCREITAASSSSDRAWTLAVDAAPLVSRTDLAVPLGLIVNELVTNAIQHSRPSGGGGRVHIVLKTAPGVAEPSATVPA